MLSGHSIISHANFITQEPFVITFQQQEQQMKKITQVFICSLFSLLMSPLIVHALTEKEWNNPAIKLGESAATINNLLPPPEEMFSKPGEVELYEFTGHKSLSFGAIEYMDGKAVLIGKTFKRHVKFEEVKSKLFEKLKPEITTDTYLVFIDNKDNSKRYLVLMSADEDGNWGPSLAKMSEAGYQRWLAKEMERKNKKNQDQQYQKQVNEIAKDLEIPFGFKNKRIAERLKEAWQGKTLTETHDPISQQLFDAEKRVYVFKDFRTGKAYDLKKDGSKGQEWEGDIEIEEFISIDDPSEPPANHYILLLTMKGLTMQLSFSEILLPSMNSFKDSGGDSFILSND